ncbi:MAG: family 20 glycosylhydrolase [Thermaceae bacterium]|nr:family 20 glycosylhydrolase [Thermaceae bacterium]
MKPLLLTLSLLLAGAWAAPLPTVASSDVYQASAPAELLPPPRQASFSTGTLTLEGLSIQVLGNAPELSWAARDLNAETQTRLGLTLPLGEGGKTVRIGTLENPILAAEARAHNLTPDQTEGYALWVNAEGATVVGFDPLGAYRGIQTLRQLLTPTGFRFAQIRDWPQFPLRMAMIYLDKDSAAVNNVLIPLLAKYKFSHLLVMCDYVQWSSTSNLWNPSGATLAEAARIASLIREYGMEPIPLIELLGHARWLFYNNQNRDLWADPQAQTPYAYDPLNPRTYEVVLPILAEAVKVFKPKYLHIGHDEVANVNRFPATPEGLAAGLPKLFVDDTLRLYDYLKGLGVGTMIWHDVAFSQAYGDQIAPNLPKDIVVAYWNYSPAADYPALAAIHEQGFPVIGSSWFEAGNAQNMAQAGLKYGSAGMLQTRWSGYFGNLSLLGNQARQGMAYLSAASSFWNPAAAVPRDTTARYQEAWRPVRFSPVAGRLVDLSSLSTRTLKDSAGKDWIQRGPSTDLSALPTGVQRFGAYKFDISGAVMLKGSRSGVNDLPQRVTLELGAQASAIAFLQTSGFISSVPKDLVGSYTFTYTDGTSLQQFLEYGREIASWTDLGLSSLFFSPAWRGKTSDGLEVGLNTWVWVNPHPDKVIQSITFESSGGQANPALIGLSLLEGVPAEAP